MIGILAALLLCCSVLACLSFCSAVYALRRRENNKEIDDSEEDTKRFEQSINPCHYKASLTQSIPTIIHYKAFLINVPVAFKILEATTKIIVGHLYNIIQLGMKISTSTYSIEFLLIAIYHIVGNSQTIHTV